MSLILVDKDEEEEIAAALPEQSFEPMYNYILCRVIKDEEQRQGSIYLPQGRAQDAAKFAEVVAVGCGHRMMDGHIEPLKVRVGDKIYFAALAGADIRLNNREVLTITREEEIFGIIREHTNLSIQ